MDELHYRKLANTNTAAQMLPFTALFTETGSIPWDFQTFQLPFTCTKPPIVAKTSRLQETMVVAHVDGVIKSSRKGGVAAMHHIIMAQIVAILDA
jgi:hypothetical protein